MLMVILFFVNFAISWFNAWTCGSTWDSTKGGPPLAHFMNWMGAIMSASGFTWCFLVIIGFLGANTPMSLIEADATGMLLSGGSLEALWSLGYLAIIFPILGSGLAITVQSWRALSRRRAQGKAGAGDYAVTGWNTFAQVSNTVSAFENIPTAAGNVTSFFSSDSSDNQSNALLVKVVILGVVIAVFGGIITTYLIINSRRRKVATEEFWNKTSLDPAFQDAYRR